jgi:2-polyprenyl-3-methyl-5-hydroxy-6-metoxy-1,4-benzoquinol methylase
MADIVGESTLTTIANANAFNRWMYETIRPHANGKILEIGSGIGNISQYFIDDNATITLSDISDEYCTILKNKYSQTKNVQGVFAFDLVHPTFDEIYKDHIGQYDTVFALNVVEHIENDTRAIANCKKLLSSGGTLIILVPAYQWLYCNFDKELGHYRRYTISKLRKVFAANAFTITKSFYFNALGTLGWFVTGKLLGTKMIPEGQMRFYNLLVPIAKILDWLCMGRYGLSVIMVGKKS